MDPDRQPSTSTTSDSPFAPPDPALRRGIEDDHPAVFDPDAQVIIGVSFDNVLKAQEYLLAMGRLRQDGVLELHDAVTVTKDADGKVNVTETIDPTPGKAAVSGGMCEELPGTTGPFSWPRGRDLLSCAAPDPRRSRERPASATAGPVGHSPMV